jgi:hypothetical protein
VGASFAHGGEVNWKPFSVALFQREILFEVCSQLLRQTSNVTNAL